PPNTSTPGGDVRIVDFNSAETIDFSAISGLSFIGNNAFSGVAGQFNYVALSADPTTRIQFDMNGDGAADAFVNIYGEFTLNETAVGSRILQTTSDVTPPP